MSTIKILISIALTFGLLIFVLFSVGGGHGTYMYAKIVYPYTMLIAIIIEKSIGAAAIFIGLFQIPIYTLILSSKPKWKYYILIIHIVLAIICLNLPTETFN